MIRDVYRKNSGKAPITLSRGAIANHTFLTLTTDIMHRMSGQGMRVTPAGVIRLRGWQWTLLGSRQSIPYPVNEDQSFFICYLLSKKLVVCFRRFLFCLNCAQRSYLLIFSVSFPVSSRVNKCTPCIRFVAWRAPLNVHWARVLAISVQGRILPYFRK